MVANVSQRKLPLMLNITLIVIFVAKSIKADYFGSLHFFLLGGILSSFLLLISVYFNKKLSIHAVGVTSLLVYAFGLSVQNEGKYPFIIPVLLIILGAVWTSRLYLNAHTNKELIGGALLGAFSQWLFYFMYWMS